MQGKKGKKMTGENLHFVEVPQRIWKMEGIYVIITGVSALERLMLSRGRVIL